MTAEVLQHDDEFYIQASSGRVDDRTQVLKHGDTFAIFDRFADMEQYGTGKYGLYCGDTRYLSSLALRINGKRPLLLSSSIRDANGILAVDLMNPDLKSNCAPRIPHGTVHLFRTLALWNTECCERVRLHNYGHSRARLSMSLYFEADFADIFEVRGTCRERRGERLETAVQESEVVLGYRGLDGRVRRTRISFEAPPARLDGSGAQFEVDLQPDGAATFRWAISCETQEASRSADKPHSWATYEQAAERVGEQLQRARAEEPRIETSHEQFNEWVHRSIADLHMLNTRTGCGLYPYAGVPWYNTIFGRDGIITALECLWFQPQMARGVLTCLAATQAQEEDALHDAEPGKIVHEVRSGEMAALGEVPFGRYYGSVDATPLYVILAGACQDRTGDVDFTRSIWPNIERALKWIDSYGDRNGDGFVEYKRRTPHGLVNQGWKDSHDSIFHADGSDPEGPISLCEVQAYVYAAKVSAARLAAQFGMNERAEEIARQARDLQVQFEKTFWIDDLSTYALALDGVRQPCRVRSSNPGHCLFAGIADDGRAARVAQGLMGADFFSGWGVRTLAAGEARFNPMSYHNGSVWPHDNALIAAGCARYGHKDAALAILQGLFDASLFFDMHRMPELFCGFPRRPEGSPTLYPVSCSPQAWAAGSALLLIQACLGLQIGAQQREVRFHNPALPRFIDYLRITGLSVGDSSIDLELMRHEQDVGVNVLARSGPVTVTVTK